MGRPLWGLGWGWSRVVVWGMEEMGMGKESCGGRTCLRGGVL